MVRLNLRISGVAEELIEALGEKLGASPKEVVLDALGLYHLAVDQIEHGGRLAIKDKDGELSAIATPTLQRLVAKVGESAATKDVEASAAS